MHTKLQHLIQLADEETPQRKKLVDQDAFEKQQSAYDGHYEEVAIQLAK